MTAGGGVVRRVAAAAVIAAVATGGGSPAWAQDPVPTPPVDAPPPADPPPSEVPGGGDGSELPVPASPDPSAPAPGAAPATPSAPTGPTAQVPAADTAAIARWRRDIAARIADGQDALALARQEEAELAQQLAEADARLAEGQSRLDRAAAERAAAESAAAASASAAREARATAAERREELRAVAVGMYLDPPQELEMAGALRGEVRDRLAARGLLAARAEVVRRAEDAARDAARAADRRIAAAARDAAAADGAVAAEERAVAALATDVASRQADVDTTRAKVAALAAELAGLTEVDTGLGGRLFVEATVASGSVVVTLHPDGTWTALPVGLPGPGDMVRIPGTSISVHRLIGDRVAALVNDARAAGVVLNGWGYRSALRQIELRQAHCGPTFAAVFQQDAASCSPPTARPGRSMHERGLAVDFSSCSARTSACYLWLSQNAWRYGLFNLPSEPWHWSTNGR